MDKDTELSVENLNELFSSKDSEKLKEAYLNLKEGNEKCNSFLTEDIIEIMNSNEVRAHYERIRAESLHYTNIYNNKKPF